MIGTIFEIISIIQYWRERNPVWIVVGLLIAIIAQLVLMHEEMKRNSSIN
jgi:hypothetical protein